MARAPFHKLSLCMIIVASTHVVNADVPTRASLTRDRVIELARDRAPQVLVARTRVNEAQGGLTTARLVSPDNPVLEAAAGPRWASSTSLDIDVSLGIPIQIAGRRGKRTAVAEAELRAAEHRTTDEQRRVIGIALNAYYRVLYADANITLATKRRSLAEELLKVGEARHQAGDDVTRLDLNLTRNELALAESQILIATSGAMRARSELAAVLGIPVADTTNVVGDLNDRRLFEHASAAKVRADLAAQREELAAAGAQVRLADAGRWPTLSLRVGYSREDQTTDILLGGLAVSLPFFNRGQGERVEASARHHRARIELAALENTIAAQSTAAQTAYTAAVSSVQLLETRAIPLVTENEQLAYESYRAGKIDLPALLVIRRDALATRMTHLDRLLDAALAGVEQAMTLQTIP